MKPKMHPKELIAFILFGVVLFVLLSAVGGWPGAAVAAVVLIYGIWLFHYERTHPEPSPADANREAILRRFDQIANLGTLRAIRQCVSPWQLLGRVILLPLLWHLMLFVFLVRLLLRSSDGLRS